MKVLSARGVMDESRCTLHAANAILKAFNKPLATLANQMITGADLMDVLKTRGLRFRQHTMYHIRTLADAQRELKTGVWYLFSKGHAMAMVNGVLTDVNPTSTPGRRHIQFIEVIQ